MSKEDVDKDWLIQLNVRPNQMSPKDPPIDSNDENDMRILNSIYLMTLGETFSTQEMDPYLIEHIQLEKECSEQDDLELIWSDDISLTLCFLSSLAHYGEYNQDDLLQRYFQWWMNGYMCPTGLCFTPHVHIKKTIDLFGETQAAQMLGIQTNLDEKTSKLIVTPSALIRISPIAYFYCKHSFEKRQEILEDFIRRMFGKQTNLHVFIEYIELLVKAINGLSKDEILNSIQLKSNPNDFINHIFFQLIHLIKNDNNNIEQGIKLAQNSSQIPLQESKYLNPYDSDINIVLTLYLQISGAIYQSIPIELTQNIYAKNTIQCLTKWIIYQRNVHLHLIEQ